MPCAPIPQGLVARVRMPWARITIVDEAHRYPQEGPQDGHQLADTRDRQDREDPADQPGDSPATRPFTSLIDGEQDAGLGETLAHHGLGMADLAATLGHGPVVDELDHHRDMPGP